MLKFIGKVAAKFYEHSSIERIQAAAYLNKLKKETKRVEDLKEKYLMKMLDGTICEFDRKKMDTRFNSEIFDIGKSIEECEKGKEGYLVKGVELLWLTSYVSELYLKQNNYERRGLVETCLSNLTLKDGSLEYLWKKPFDLIVKHSKSDELSAYLDEFGIDCTSFAI
ncbi:MAG: hypothetical protein VXV96_14670 [Bdellovibrionota bacterium]|nr:hypothetical protein [Bdellovibrionota bacterium]